MDHEKQLSARQKLHQKLARRALKAAGGSQTGLAEKMGGNVRQGHVRFWVNAERLVSPLSSLLFEKAVSRKVVRREQFYPELYEGMEYDDGQSSE